MRIKLVITYDGTAYCGWQRQKNGVSVQEIVEKAVEEVCGSRATVTGSGRTDSGVHAAAQVAHFDAECSIPPERIYLALNTRLPDDVKVVSSEKADDGFHARFSAKKKTYAYDFYFSDVILPLKDRYSLKLDVRPDFSLMRAAADVFCGEHDFAAFCGTGSSVKDTVRTVYSVDIDERQGGFTVKVTGNGFLYNMVRVMAGTILAAGYGEISPEDISSALESGKRSRYFKTLPAKGLTLLKVEYN